LATPPFESKLYTFSPSESKMFFVPLIFFVISSPLSQLQIFVKSVVDIYTLSLKIIGNIEHFPSVIGQEQESRELVHF